jgi:hypothetical protein
MIKFKNLTAKQAAFVMWFLAPGPTWLNATQSARAAGFRWPGKSGSRLLSYPHVARLVEYGVNLMAVDHAGVSVTLSCPHCGGLLSPERALGGEVHVGVPALQVDIDDLEPEIESTGEEHNQSASPELDLEAMAALVRMRRGD